MIKKDKEVFNAKNKAILIIGPTAVGKTDLSYALAQEYTSAIINCDIAQAYTPLSIGTAKPLLPHPNIPHYLFNALDTPQDWNVLLYRNACQELIVNLNNAQTLPLIVGGSMFYAQSLFFEPVIFETKEYLRNNDVNKDKKKEYSWQLLKSIDPIRADKIDPNDFYRIQRALDIWYDTGQLPSSKKTTFVPIAQESIIFFLDRERDELWQNIEKRTIAMLKSGWIEEVQNLSPEWREFIRKKKPIGYVEIDHYLEKGSITVDELATLIIFKTRQYAKRQRTYWRMLKNKLIGQKGITLYEVNLTLSTIDLYLEQLKTVLNPS